MPRDIKYLKSDLTKLIEGTITRAMLQEFGEAMRDMIYRRVKAGKGLTSDKVSVGGNSLTKLKELSPGYQRYRRKKDLGPFGSARRSNLTFSGELLESIIVKITGKGVTVEIEDVGHSHFQGGMRKLADKVSKEGRPFFGLSDTEVKILDNFVRRKIRERIRQLNS